MKTWILLFVCFNLIMCMLYVIGDITGFGWLVALFSAMAWMAMREDAPIMYQQNSDTKLKEGSERSNVKDYPAGHNPPPPPGIKRPLPPPAPPVGEGKPRC